VSFPIFPHTKYSVNWIGQIPSEWNLSKIKYLARLYTGNSLNDLEKELYKSENLTYTPYVSSKNINLDTRAINYETGIRMPQDIEGFKKAQKGSFLICIEGGSAGKKIARVNQDVHFVNKLCCIDAFEASDFLYYFFQSINFLDKFNLSTSGLIGGVSTSLLKNFDVPLPSEIDQEKICKFLDREIAKIDDLINKQEKLIGLLIEKMHISSIEVVTKGLNQREYKAISNIFWIENIPSHWTVERIKTIFQIKKRIAGKLGFDVLSITQNGIKVKDTESNDGQQSMDYSKYQIVEKGDFAMNHMDLLTGYVDIAVQDGVTSPDYRVFSIRNSTKYYPEFYLLLLQLCYKSKLFYPFGQGSSQLGRWRLPTEAFNGFFYPVPPYEEQVEIANYIQAQNSKFALLIQKSKRSIELLKERRLSLISDVITGKIDVRSVSGS
jgi:type I restriction enzyme S subunit